MLHSRLRRWPVVAGVVVLLFLTGAAILYLSQSTSATPANFVTYFPGREAMVLYLDVNAMRASGLLEKLVGSTVGEDPEYKNFIQQSGFDYKRDLNHVMLNSAGGVHYFVLQGHFDWGKLRSYASSQGGTCKDDYCYMKGSTPDRVISWRKLRRDMMALASARDEAGARAVDRRSPEAARFDVPSAPLWIHLPAQVLRSASQLPPGTRMFAKALEPAERAVFALGPAEKDFQLAVDVVCSNQEDAATLKAQFESITKLLVSLIAREKKTPNPDDLSGILASGNFDRVDKHVRGRWAIRRKYLDSLGGT